MSVRLPTPGGDDGDWGSILNAFLEVAHNSEGALIPGAVSNAGAEMTSNKAMPSGYAPLDSSSKVPTLNLGGSGATASTYLRGDQTWVVPPGSTDATTSSKGVVQLAGDLSGTAVAPTVVGLTRFFNVLDYGATTASSDNQTAINNAFAAAAINGGVVYFPPGTWNTSGGHVVPMNVSVQGAGKGVTTIQHKGVGTYCFFVGSGSGGPNPPAYMGQVGNFSISGESAGNGTGSFGQQIGIKVLNCLLFTLENIYLTLLYTGVLIDGGDEVALGAGTFAGDGYVANVTASNIFIFLHVYRWVTNTTYLFCYAYGNGPITTGSVGIWMDTKPATSTLVNPSVEGFDTGYLISTTQDSITFLNPRLENCNTYVSWQNNSSGHIIIGGQTVAGVWASGTSAGSNTQIATDGWFPAVTSLPSASSSYRHAIYRIDGGSGVADGIYICTKDASGNYAWHEITVGTGSGSGITGVPGPSDQGLKGWTYDPTTTGSAGTALTSQRIQYVRVIVPAAGTISGAIVVLTSAASGSTPAPANTFLGLYNSSGTQVAVTSDVTASTTSSGVKQLAFGTPYSASAGIYYIGIVQTAATPMALTRAALGSSTVYNLGTASAPYRFNTGATGQTSLPSSVTLSGLSAASDAYWVGLY